MRLDPAIGNEVTAAVNIYISSIRIHAICNLGSLNVGKTILCRNTAQTAWTGQTESSASAATGDAFSGNASPGDASPVVATPEAAAPGVATPEDVTSGNTAPGDAGSGKTGSQPGDGAGTPRG